MVQRLSDGLDGDAGPSNCSVAWQGLHFSPSSKIGDMLLQLKQGAEIKLQRRSFDLPEEDQPPKRSKLMDMPDVSFKAWGGEMVRSRVPFTVSHSFHPLDEPSPLGLTLKKTPSFLDLVSMTIAQGGSGGDLIDGSGSGVRAGIPTSCPTQGKLKASNFPASTLTIGAWERVSRYEGDVVAKCYYAKRKLVWEVLEAGLKSKIELQWSDISAIKASYGDGQTGVLEVEVSRPPLFFKETNPQPRKHTLWEATSDFTGGEATVCKRHLLQFPEGVLNKHYEKLLQCDARLKALAGPGPEGDILQELKREEADESSDTPGKKIPASPKVKLEVMAVRPDTSPSSVMESRGSDDSDGEEQSQALVEAGGGSSAGGGEDDQTVDQKPRVLVLTDNDVLNEIAQILLGETNAAKASPERGLFRVSSMSGFFEDNWLPASYTVSDWNSADSNHGNEGYGIDDKISWCSSRNGNSNVLFELDEKPLGGSSGAAGGTGSTSLQESVKQCFSRHGSSGDLLVNLPRIASLPQLFENGISRRDSHLSLLELL